MAGTGDGPNETGLDTCQVLGVSNVVEFDLEALPIARQLDFVERTFGSVEIFFLFSDQPKPERDFFATNIASCMKDQACGTRQIEATTFVAPVLSGILPRDTTPAGVCSELTTQACYARFWVGLVQ